MSLLLLVAAAALPLPPLQDDPSEAHAVVVHSANPAKTVSAAQLRRIFKAQKQFWSGGDPIDVLLPRAGTATKQVLLEELYGMSERQLKRYWANLVYRNRIVTPPRSVPSSIVGNRMLERMRAGITAVPAREVLSDADVKTLTIDGKRPGDEGYLLVHRPEAITTATDRRATPKSPVREASATRLLDDDSFTTLSEWDGNGFPPIHLQFFGHGEYEYEDEKEGDESSSNNAFSIESIDMLATSAITDRVSVLAEILYEAQDEGDWVVEVERLLLNYRVSDAFSVKAGRFLTGIGYWNSRYNHGEWLQTSIDRPELLDFEDDGGLLPIHSIGVGVSGALYMESAAVDYVVELTNGRGPTADIVQVKEDANKDKALNVSVGIEPEGVPGLRIGGGIYIDDLPANGDDDAGPEHGELDETITNFYVAYDDADWELMAEYFDVEHDGDGVKADSGGWYAQVGRHFGAWTPYVRFDEIERANDGTYFDSTQDGTTTAVGVRYDFERQVALTLQYEHADLDGGPDEDDEETRTVVLQVSFSF